MDLLRPVSDADLTPEFTDDHESSGFFAGFKPSDAGPDVHFTAIVDSPLQRYFKSNFHILVDEIRASGIEDVKLFPLTMKPKPKFWARNQAETTLREMSVPEEEYFLMKAILTNLYLDLILLADIGWPACLDPLHASLVKDIAQGKFLTHTAPGFLALELLFPNVGDLSWEQISKFRANSAVRQFRRKLVEVEVAARSMLGEATSEEIADAVSRSLLYDLLDEIRAARGSLLQDLASSAGDIALQIIGGFFPPATLAEIGITVAKAVKKVSKHYKGRSAWIAGFMGLRSLTDGRG
jgi:hypothetical protein